MKYLILFFSIINWNYAFSQSLPNAELVNLQGQIIDAAELKNPGSPLIISFWATWFTPCCPKANY